jgi:hypothetical protein
LVGKFVDAKRGEKNGGERLLHNFRLLPLGKTYEFRIKEPKYCYFECGKDANVEFIAREENSGKSQSFIFYTHDQKVADRVFKNRYNKTTTEDLLDTTSNDSKENNILEHKRVRMNETLNVICKAIAGPTFEEERLLAEPAENLSDTLFSDLEEIGLSTIEREAIQENAVEPLPEELFDDLSDEDSQVKG